MRKAIELFLLDLINKDYNIRWVQGVLRFKYREGDMRGVIIMYDTQTDEELGEIILNREEVSELEGGNDLGDLIRAVKYPLLDPELLRDHIRGMIKVDPSYNRYAMMILEPTEEPEELDYNEQAEKLAKELGLTLEVGEPRYDRHFISDKEERWIFPCALIRGDREYRFRFGQSIAAGAEEPGMYDVLACMQKYDPGDLQEFCANFGYELTGDEEEDALTEAIYETVMEEWEAMERMFTEEELEKLHDIA